MDESCSSVAVAPISVSGEIQRLSGKEMFPKLAALTDEFTQTQYEAAKLFEITYHSISNFPDLAEVVRLSAHEARTSHEFASALMKKYALTASQIVDTTFPLILEAVDQIETDVVKAYFAMIIEWAEDMQKETENTRDRYVELTKKLQQDIMKVKEKQKQQRNEKRDNDVQKQYEEKAKKADEERAATLEMQEIEKEKELDELIKARNTITGELKEGSNSGKAYALIGLVPVIGWGCAYFGLKADKANFKKKTQMKSVVEEDVKRVENERDDAVRKKQEAQQAALERFKLIQQLDVRTELLGDENRLMEAILRLGEAGQHLDKLSRFWADMAVLLKYLGNEIVVGKPQLESIEKPGCAKAFKRILDRASEKWVRFGEICSGYVLRCENDSTLSIDSVYGFLDGRADLMSDAQRKKEMEKIKQEFKEMLSIEDITEVDNDSD